MGWSDNLKVNTNQSTGTSPTHLGEDWWSHQQLKVLSAAISRLFLKGDLKKICAERRESRKFQVFSFHRTAVVPARFLWTRNAQLPLMETATVGDKGSSFVRFIPPPARSEVARCVYKTCLMWKLTDPGGLARSLRHHENIQRSGHCHVPTACLIRRLTRKIAWV